MSEFASPRVSIILPVFNGQDYLDAAITSLVTQTFTDFELIIVDDGSSDASVSIIQAWEKKDQRIRLIVNSEPHGLPNALNRGLTEARGEFIARADQDDLHRNEKLAAQVHFLDQHHEIHILGTAYQPFSTTGARQPIFHPTDPLLVAWKMLSGSAFCHPSVMFRHNLIPQIGMYPSVAAEDFAYFSRIVQRWPGKNLQTVYVDYREHPTNYSKTRSAAIAKSTQETFVQNIKTYLGEQIDPQPLYDYLVRRSLSRHDLPNVAKMCLSIAKSLQRRYHRTSFNPAVLLLKGRILIDICKVRTRTLLGMRPLGKPLFKYNAS